MQVSRLFSLLIFSVLVMGLAPRGVAADPGTYLGAFETPTGVAAIVNAGQSDLPVELAKASEFVIHVSDPDPAAVEAQKAKAAAAGLLGKRIYVEQGTPGQLPFADNLVDLLIVENLEGAPAEAEVMRVLAPHRGVAFAGTQSVRKPALEGADNWTHPLHGADNNPASNDTAYRPDPLLQYLALPMQTSFQGTMLVEDGIRVEFSDWVTKKGDRANIAGKLMGRSLYNGQILWEHALPDNIEPDQPISALAGGKIYLADGTAPQILVVDARSGEALEPIRISDHAEDRAKWLAVENGRLHALIGEAKPTRPPFVYMGGGGNRAIRDEQAKAGSQLAAFDLATGHPLWRHEEPSVIDYRTVALRDGKTYFLSEGSRLACLDPSGQVAWENSDSAWISKLSGPGRANPNSEATSTLIAGPDQRLLVSTPGSKFRWLVDATNGEPLAELRGGGPKAFFAESRLWTPGGWLDPTTGEKVADSTMVGKGCGIVSWVPEMESGIAHVSAGIKSPCGVGTYATGGVVIFSPSQCDCWPFARGAAALTSGSEVLKQAAENPEHPLQVGNAPAPSLAATDGDWATYRGNIERHGMAPRQAPGTAQLRWKSSPAQPMEVPEGHGQQRLEWLERPTPPITAGGLAISAGSDGLIQAVRTSDGQTAWNYATGGPILTAPTFANGRVYAGSADGWVYCLDAATGQLAWRWRGAPMDRHMMAYGKLVSSWPVTAVLADDGTLYGVAGQWFQNGTVTFALDAATGEPKWTTWTPPSYAVGIDLSENHGIAPSGSLSMVNGKLWVRSYLGFPGVFDPTTGERIQADEMMRAATDGNWSAGVRHANAGQDMMVFDEFVLQGGRPLLYNPDLRHDKTAARYIAYYVNDHAQVVPNPLSTSAIPSSMPAPAFDGEKIAFAGGVTPGKRPSFRSTNPTYGLSIWDAGTWRNHFENDRSGSSDDPDAADPTAGPERPAKGPKANLPDLKQPQNFSLDVTKADWRAEEPDVSALAMTPDAVITAEGRREPTERGEPEKLGDWALVAYDKASGAEKWRVALPAEPMLNGIAPAGDGSWIVSLRDGSLAAVGE